MAKKISLGLDSNNSEKKISLGLPDSPTKPFESASVGESFLDSQYDLGTHPSTDLNENRAQEQTILDKWGNAAPKLLGTAFTSLAEPFVNFTYGLGSAITSGEMENFYDNEVTRSFDQLNDNLAKSFPHYATQKEQASEWWQSPGYANFWADKVGNGAGFVLGALGAGLLTAGVGTFGAVASRSSKVFNSLGKLSKAGKVLDATSDGAAALNKITEARKLIKLRSLSDQLGASFVGAVGESGMEARSIKQETYDRLFEQKTQELGRFLTDEEEKEIQEIADSAGNAGFGLNLAIVGSSNMFQFGSLFKGGYNQQKQLLNRISKTDGVYAADKVSKLDMLGTVLSTPIEESLQESAQYATEKGVQD
jgi:hypothetical protein